MQQLCPESAFLRRRIRPVRAVRRRLSDDYGALRAQLGCGNRFDEAARRIHRALCGVEHEHLFRRRPVHISARGMNVGLGTDVAGGFSDSVFRAMSDAIQASKLRWRSTDDSLAPLTVSEAFYLGTKGGGAFFGKVGLV